jgi:rubrerythrin
MSISAMKQAFSALREMRHALSRAHDTMRRPTKYVSDAMTKSESAIKALQQAIAEAEKQEPLVWMNKYGHVASFKNDEYTAPLYTAPVHASDMSQERVDETAKCGHEFECPRCGHCCQQREWVGLDGDIPDLGLVTEEFYNGMLCAEDILRRRNT